MCNVFSFHKLYTDAETVREIDAQCRNAQIGCVECKQIMARNLVEALAPVRERRSYYVDNPGEVREIMQEGSRRARQVAARTMEEVRAAIKLT